MNRQQRRHVTYGRMATIDPRSITWPWQLTDAECETMLADRLMLNLLQTEHPFHHQTESGTIVEPDPTLEYYLGRLSPQKQEAIRSGWLTRAKPDAPKAVPVNRRFYGHDMYERH